MKKMIMLSLTACCIFFSACNSTSIGIIGGSDGPTSIYVNENAGKSTGSFGEQYEKKPVRMFNVDGELYYDSGLISDETPRCGTLDGELKKTVKENEIPLNTGEANFDAEGYQNATSITKEVNINGKWIIFKKYNTYGRTLDGLKYCFYIKGHLRNAVVDSEIIVLTENKDITFNDVYEPLLSSQATAGAETGKTIHNPILSDEWGIYLHTDNVSAEGVILKIEQFGGSPSGKLQTGSAYVLEKTTNDEWQIINPVIDNYAWNSIAYIIKNNDITELEVNWKFLYGKLSPGFYRLSKEIMDFRASGDYDKKTYEAYFTVQ